MLEVSFVRRRGQRDRVYVHRDDGTELDWSFPTYGDNLPHDLCHLVVEDGLGLTEGFWGLVDQGVTVGLVRNEATLMRDGIPLVDHPGVDFSGLVEAEGAVAVLGSPTVEVEDVGAFAIARVPVGRAAVAEGDAHDRAARVGVTLPASATPAAVAAIGARLDELVGRWRALADGGAITLTFARR
jgi:hypothetical protein